MQNSLLFNNLKATPTKRLPHFSLTLFVLCVFLLLGARNGYGQASIVTASVGNANFTDGNSVYLQYKNANNSYSLAKYNGNTLTIVPSPTGYEQDGRGFELYNTTISNATSSFDDYLSLGVHSYYPKLTPTTVLNNCSFSDGTNMYLRYIGNDNNFDLAKYDGNTLTIIPSPAGYDGSTAGNITNQPVMIGSTIYMAYRDNNGKIDLAKYDGNTLTIIPSPSGHEFDVNSVPTAIGNTLYLKYRKNDFTSVLAKYDGNTLTIIPNPTGYNIGGGKGCSSTYNWNGTLYALYQDNNSRYDIAKYDGTNLTMYPSPNTLINGINGGNLIKMGSNLYSSSASKELVKFDGTNYTIVNKPSGYENSNSGVWQFNAVIDNVLYMTYINNNNQRNLAKYDGSTLTIVPNPSGYQNTVGFMGNLIIKLGSNLYLGYKDNNYIGHLAKYDGTNLTMIDHPNSTDFTNLNTGLGDILFADNSNIYLKYVVNTNTIPKLYKYDGTSISLVTMPNGLNGTNARITAGYYFNKGLIVGSNAYFYHTDENFITYLAKLSVCSPPTTYTLSSTSTTYCTGGTGVELTLSNSEVGVNYQLKNGGNNVGTAIAGTGAALSFGNQTAGTYTVEATKTSDGCTVMTGSIVLTTTAPTIFNVTGGGTYCIGGTGVAVGLASSQSGVNYQLKNGVNNIGTGVSGTGSIISFGNQTSAGVYTVVATSTSNGCTATMIGNATLTAATSTCCPSANTIYVNSSVLGGNRDGSSWTNAYANLSDALTTAHNCSNVKTIKVAAGKYIPTRKPFNSNGVEVITSSIRDQAFHVPDGVTIEGGYNAATGNRDINTYVTTLSGDFNNDDIVNGSGSTLTITGNTENAYHVVVISSLTTSSAVTKVDGFSIVGGNANEFGGFTVQGNPIARNKGGGMFIQNGTNVLTNNTVMNNTASNFASGGGIYIKNGTNTLTNNKVNKNVSIGDNGNGGGICIEGGLNTMTSNSIYQNLVTGLNCRGGGIRLINNTNTISNNTIYENSVQTGGGISFSGGTNNMVSNNNIYGNMVSSRGGGICTESENNIRLTNNIMYNNVSSNGGGININNGTSTLINNLVHSNIAQIGGGIYMNNATDTLINNTIYNNTSSFSKSGGGLYTNLSTNIVQNCIFWENKINTSATAANADVAFSGANTNTFKNNLLQSSSNNYTTTGSGVSDIGTNAIGNIFNQDPFFANTTNPAGVDGSYRTADDGLALSSCSFVINKGDNTLAPTTDITGIVRPQLGTVDMGAYESNSYITPPVTYNVTGTGSYCSNDVSNVAVGLDGSETGVTYQLRKGITNVGTPINGTGSAISFGTQTAGTYTVVAIKSGGCVSTMLGNAVVASVFCCPNTLYVNASVSGGSGDGTSWANAYASLSDALALAHTCNGTAKTIKVAAGTYKPTKKPFNSSGIETTTSNNRDKTFHIPTGVTLEGGYNAATGNRDITANVTTLSGDFNNDDVINGGGTTLSITGNTENAYHVVVISAPTNSSVVTKIDGITIIGGYANEFGSVQAGSNNISKNKGGGLYAQNGTNILTNNTVMGNGASSYGSGGGIYIINGTN